MDFLTGENVALILFFLGLAGIISSRRMLKTIISIGIMEIAPVIFFVTMNADEQSVPPIGVTEGNIADPLPQALMITAIVIGVAVTAISLVMFINLYHKYGTSNWEKANKIRMEQG